MNSKPNPQSGSTMFLDFEHDHIELNVVFGSVFKHVRTLNAAKKQYLLD